MLASVDDLADVEGFVRKWLGALADYDERKHTELLKTLTQYLQHGGGYEATSQALSVHRSTLKYRLHRIRELTGLTWATRRPASTCSWPPGPGSPSRPSAARGPRNVAARPARAGYARAPRLGPPGRGRGARAEKKLRRRQRDLSRKQRGSSNRDKARVKVARAHARVADARREFHHQLSTALIRENQAVAVEDLAVSGLARTRLAKSVHDAGWSSFVNMLEYKARMYGREFHRISRLGPNSQVRSACGAKDGPKPPHVRAWQCQACGAGLDRDINAAVNIAKAAGLAVTACGAQVRPGAMLQAPRSEAGTLPKPRREAA